MNSWKNSENEYQIKTHIKYVESVYIDNDVGYHKSLRACFKYT